MYKPQGWTEGEWLSVSMGTRLGILSKLSQTCSKKVELEAILREVQWIQAVLASIKYLTRSVSASEVARGLEDTEACDGEGA